MPAVYTVGHSTRAAAELLSLLRENGVELLTDVRRFPGSRRYPQFSRQALAAALEAEGIAYLHAPDLGGRRPPRPDSPNTAWRVAAFRGYADYMDTAEFRAALERLIADAARRTTAILCAEAVPWRCHRRLIADALVAQGVEVRHILGPGRLDLHVLNPAARVLAGGRLLYSGPDGEQASLDL
ncbi:MAG TPA: DUF488 domain-containing protein [Thermoanaerobaculia bacterium]|nr:DUF488 domain-containing protein [Thermoanaerobaculia bacterium]